MLYARAHHNIAVYNVYLNAVRIYIQTAHTLRIMSDRGRSIGVAVAARTSKFK